MGIVWHPFTQEKTAAPPIRIVRGKGALLYDENGLSYIDGISSWWVNLHGHAHPYIAERIAAQAKELEHVIFAGFTHPPAEELAMRLLNILPGPFSKVFYSDNGSTAVEVALKMALQYWHNRDPKTEKVKVICLKNSYHGDTFGAMSAAGQNRFNRPFWSHLFEVEMIEPWEEEKLHAILKEGKCACFIFEPLVLAAGGMILYKSQWLEKLLQICQKADILTIADEVMTGFGRTGPLFACEFLETKPDVICLSKGLTGGFLPLGVTACCEKIYDAFLGDSISQAFLHGHSYTANPLACSSALASLDLLEQSGIKRKFIATSHVKFCKEYQDHPKLKRCESLGTLLVLEFYEPQHFRFLEQGILLRPLQNVLYVLPPYCIDRDLEKIYEAIYEFLEKGDPV